MFFVCTNFFPSWRGIVKRILVHPRVKIHCPKIVLIKKIAIDVMTPKVGEKVSIVILAWSNIP